VISAAGGFTELELGPIVEVGLLSLAAGFSTTVLSAVFKESLIFMGTL
jgi:hypothetical protein